MFQPYTCLKTAEVADSIMHLQQIEVRKINQEVSISGEESLNFKWSTTVHMVFFTLGEEFKDFVNDLKGKTSK